MSTTWARFVLMDGLLEPGSHAIDHRHLSRREVMVELRRPAGASLPIERLKTLIESCGRLMVDPHTMDHGELIDCLMLGSALVCIDQRADYRELQLAHATSENIVVKLELDMEILEEPEQVNQRLRELSSLVGDLILVKTRLPGILEEWWHDLPRDIRNSWRWMMAPAEGERMEMGHARRIVGWAVNGNDMMR